MREARSGVLPATSPVSWREVAEGLLAWMREREYSGWDPFDLLASPLVRALTLGLRWPAVAWTQLGRRSPIQLRPLLRVPRTRNPKTLALVLSGLARLEGHRDEAEALAAALVADQRPGGGWGYPFPWANRSFRVPAHTPASVPTAFVGHALLDALERWPDLRGGEEAAEAAYRAAEFVRRDLNRIPGPEGTFCYSYTPLDRRGVHNASALAASLLARVGRRLEDPGIVENALQAARFTARAQEADGSWPYGTDSRDRWIDSYHTGYLLWALERTGHWAGTDELSDIVGSGLRYWRRSFFDGPAVGLRPGKPYPVDMHAVAQAILTALHFRRELEDGGELARELGRWSVERLRAPDGHFHYRRHRLVTNRIPYMRWVQAWSFRAFAELAGAQPPPDA